MKTCIFAVVLLFQLFKESEELVFLQQFESSKSELTCVLYNSNNNNGITIKPRTDNKSLEAAFVKGLPCVFITHGWIRSIYTDSVQDIVKALLKIGNVNIIAVDWQQDACCIYSVVAERAVLHVGPMVGNEVMEMIDLKVCSPDNIHLIGHSLGAHVMGIAGKKVQEKRGTKLHRITGLDPAAPMFEYGTMNSENRLHHTDALCVDVIHTDGGRFGYKSSLGQTDFYPNGGGPNQPGCSMPQIFCSHMRAFQFFAESVNNSEAFLSMKCSSYRDYLLGLCKGNPTDYMGYPTACRVHGDFYVTTGSISPYSLENEV